MAAAAVVLAALGTAGAVTPAGASPAPSTTTPTAPVLSGPAVVSKVTTQTESVSAGTTVVTSTTTGIAASYAKDVLRVTWGAGSSLTVSGAGPLYSGQSLTASTASIVAVVGQQCGPMGSFAAVAINQITLTHSGALASLALQFGCLGGLASFTVFGTIGVDVPPGTRSPGYSLVESDATLTPFGGGVFFDGIGLGAGGATGFPFFPNQPVVGAATTTLDGGYWLVASDGGIFAYGDAAFEGSTGWQVLNNPVVGMASAPALG